ncbi:hypothetical protein Lser_V15G11958 [Lactuca serriola]
MYPKLIFHYLVSFSFSRFLHLPPPSALCPPTATPTSVKKLWYLAAPTIFTSVCQYSLRAFAQTFVDHVGTLGLATVSIENTFIAGLCLGIMIDLQLGMATALEMLCGKAFRVGLVDMLGVYMKRSWVIMFVTGLILMLLYIFVTPLLIFIGQTKDISPAARKMASCMILQLFAYAFNYPIAKFLQAQSKIMVMAYISAVLVSPPHSQPTSTTHILHSRRR